VNIQITSLQVLGDSQESFSEILTPEALLFVEKLARKFDARRTELLQLRNERQEQMDRGVGMPDFLPETEHIRKGDWTIAPLPKDLQNRRVEITGPVDRKMIINALNSGAKVFMADFEDANSPTWKNVINGQINLRDAVNETISFENPANGKKYSLNDETATLVVRPRGWHLEEKHVLLNGKPISGGLFDFGLYFFHNAKQLIANGSGPYFYLPKMESYKEARLWNDVFVLAQDELGIPQGTIKATVLIETIMAAFEMDEILY
jgi:malate synthase